VTAPTVANFLMKHHKKLQKKKEINHCKLTENKFAEQVNQIAKDDARNTHSSLFVLPDGYAFTKDFVNSDASPSPSDKLIKIVMCQLESTDEIGNDENDIRQQVTQTFYPGHWILRLLHKTAMPLDLKDCKNEDESITSFFSGMALEPGALANAKGDKRGVKATKLAFAASA